MNPFLAFLVATAGLLAGGSAKPHASVLIIKNARVWTGDPAMPEASIIVIQDDRFIFVGNDAPDKRQIGKEPRIIDAKGAFIIPGLIDAHLHLVSGGLFLTRLNLRQVADKSAFVTAIAEQARAAKSGEWILGGRWSTESWADPAQPTKEWIDGVTADHPALLSRMDGHGALANSAALALAKITKDGPEDPPGGKIDRDPQTREPTGILRDKAIDLVESQIPKPNNKTLDAALQLAISEAHRHGITTVDTMSEWSDFAVLRRAHSRGALNLRVRVYVMEDDWAKFIGKVKDTTGDRLLRICGFKGYMDGSLGSRTAYMAEPYADQPENHGLLRQPDQSKLESACLMVTQQGYSTAFHAIGDQANHLLLDVYENVLKRMNAGWTWPGNDTAVRLRIEHAQHLLPADILRIGQLGVVASMQPYHKADDGRYAEKAIGRKRCLSSYAFRSLLNAKSHLAFGSDWPVVSLNPFLGIHAAVTGKTLNGKVFIPEQSISVEEALRAYTAGGAYASGDEHRIGQIKPGYLADFVVLDRDPFAIPPDDLQNIRVIQTVVGGKEVYRTPTSGPSNDTSR